MVGERSGDVLGVDELPANTSHDPTAEGQLLHVALAHFRHWLLIVPESKTCYGRTHCSMDLGMNQTRAPLSDRYLEGLPCRLIIIGRMNDVSKGTSA